MYAPTYKQSSMGSGINSSASSAPSSSSSGFSNQYNFSNLPSFMSSKRNSGKASTMASAGERHPNALFDQSFANSSSSASSVAHKVELPFMPTKNFPVNEEFFRDSRLPPGPRANARTSGVSGDSERRVFSPSARDHLFGHRVWSAVPEKGRLFSEKRNYVNGEGKNKYNKYGGDAEDEADIDPHVQLYKLAKNVRSLVFVLLYKSGLWVMWLLNLLFVFLGSQIHSIPNPVYTGGVEVREARGSDAGVAGGVREEEEEEEEEEDGDVVVAESTPVKIGKVDEALVETEKRNPLFYKKLRDINGSLAEKLERMKRREEGFRLKLEEKDDSVVEGRVVNGGKYGTHFFNKGGREGDVVNLETCYMKSSMKPGTVFSEPREEDLYAKANGIKKDLMHIAQTHGDVGRGQVVAKPSFTRSTKRFEDLEWLVDDREDYLNNLESTRLYQEYQKILNERKKMQQLVKLTKLKETVRVQPLSKEQNEEVEEIWDARPGGVLMKKYGVNIESRDLLTLLDRHWLNDNIIDFYMQLIKDEVCEKRKLCKMHVFSTFFYTTLKAKGYEGVKRWGKRAKVDVSELDYIFVPMNLNGTHWALSMIDNVNERFVYVDSLYSDGMEDLYLLVDYMKQETRKNHGDTMNGKNYDLYTLDGDYECPSQENGFDCGVFACTAVDYLARNRALTYSQKDMPVLRRRMAWEVLHGKMVEH